MLTIKEQRRDTDPAIVRAFGAVRRFVITLTDAAIWQVVGLMLPGGQEVLRAEVFGGIGIAARPPNGAPAEAIGVMVGDASTPVIVAVRDEQTRAASVGDLVADETVAFNSKARVYVKADGTIEARTHSGTAQALATKADLQSVVEAVNSFIAQYVAHVHGGGTLTGALTAVPTVVDVSNASAPTGTSVLKGQ